MKYETKFRLLISYLVASQIVAQQPVLAQDGASALNGFLAALAEKNGVMYVNAGAPARSGPAAMPTKEQLVSAIRNLPKPVSYANGMPTPDPTAEEALTLIPPVTDVQPITVDGKTLYPILGTVTQTDETLTGLFEDLSTVDTSDLEPVVDPSWFDTDTDGDGNTILTPTAYEIVEPVLTEDQKALAEKTVGLTTSIGLLEKKITLDPNSTLQFAAKRETAVDAASGDIAILSLPDVPFGQVEETMPSMSVAVSSAADTTHGIMLKGFVETDVDGTNFIHIDGARQDMQLASGHELNAGKGALLWLEQDDEQRLCVKSASHGVRVKLNHGLQVDLAPGEELVWARDARDAAACLKDGVSRRNVARHVLPDGSCLIVSEFSLLHHLSKQSGDTTVLPYREKMLKTIAALNVACRHHGRYHTVRAG